MLSDEFPALWPRLIRWAITRTRSLPDAEDLVQDALIRCWRAELRGQQIHTGYVYQALNSVYVDDVRKQAVRPRVLGISAEIERITPNALPDEPISIEARDWIEHALAGLTERQRQVLLLAGEGLMEAEIAAATGDNLDAVKKLKRRGRLRAVQYMA